MLSTVEIMALIPHRHPFLLIDRILELEPGTRAVAEKLVGADEPFFAGHFPGNPIMPGVLIIEALAQTGAVAALSLPEHRGRRIVLAGIDNCRFRRIVRPGEALRLEVSVEKIRRGIGKAQAHATVAGESVCEAGLLFAITDG